MSELLSELGSEVVYARYTRYVLAIHEKPKRVVTSSSSSTSSSTHQTHQKGNSSEELSEESSESDEEASEEVSESGVKNLTGGLNNEELSESRQRKISLVSGSDALVTQKGLREMMKGLIIEMSGGKPPEVQQLPGTPVPIEEVERGRASEKGIGHTSASNRALLK